MEEGVCQNRIPVLVSAVQVTVQDNRFFFFHDQAHDIIDNA